MPNLFEMNNSANTPPWPGANADAEPPLFVVDLDGTLLRCDLLHDALARLALCRPAHLFGLAWAHRKSLPAFKHAIASSLPFDPTTLPYDPAVLAKIHERAACGAKIVLATASPEEWARPVAEHLGIFDAIIASPATSNLKGDAKLAAIRARFGTRPFAYAGDSAIDLPLFQAAEAGRFLAGSSASALRALDKAGLSAIRLSPRDQGWRHHLRLLRPLHWSKNLLVLLPAATSWGLYEPARLPAIAIAFLAFCAAASAVYVLNDLSDLAADRSHPEKRRRPLAAGLVSVPAAMTLAAGLAIAGLLAAAFAGPWTLGGLIVYFALNLSYTGRIKELPLADIVLLGAFYLTRVIVGLGTLGQPLAPWFLSFLGCVFAELALWKRYVETRTVCDTTNRRRSYSSADAPVLLAFGVGFSFCAAIILGLYLQSSVVSTVYRSPACLFLLVPVLLLHNLGMWLDASRGHAGPDPVLRILLSRKSWLTALAASGVLLLARLLPAT